MPEPKEVKVEARKGVIEVNVTSNVTSRKIKFPFNVGNTIAEAIKLYGEDVVFSAWVEQVVIKAQGNTRRQLDETLEDNKTPKYSEAQVIEKGKTYKPGVSTRAPGKSKVEKAAAIFDQMSPEDKAAFIKSLQAKKA